MIVRTQKKMHKERKANILGQPGPPPKVENPILIVMN